MLSVAVLAAAILSASPLLRAGAHSDALLPKHQVEGSRPSASKPTALHTAPRHDFSGVQMTYLGRDRVLSFNQWSGEYSLWQYGALRAAHSLGAHPLTPLPRSAAERDSLSQCDALSWPPLASGRWRSMLWHEFVFVGFSQVIALEPLTGKLILTE